MIFFSVIFLSLVFAKETVINSACILAKTEFETYKDEFNRDWRRFNYGYNPGKGKLGSLCGMSLFQCEAEQTYTYKEGGYPTIGNAYLHVEQSECQIHQCHCPERLKFEDNGSVVLINGCYRVMTDMEDDELYECEEYNSHWN